MYFIGIIAYITALTFDLLAAMRYLSTNKTVASRVFMKIDNEICAVHVRISRETESGLKAIARKERESMATIIRAVLRQTVARGGIESLALFATDGAAHDNNRDRAVA
jgi:hypothetical protein